MSTTIIPQKSSITLVPRTSGPSLLLSNSVVQLGATDSTSHTAGASLSGHRMVYLDSSELLQYAENTTPSHAERVLGMTTGAITSGASGPVLREGEITEPSWNWTIGSPIFLGVNGLLTQTRPTASGSFVLQVAFPVTSTKVFIDIKQAFFII